jgi:hypothetical protein
MRKLALVPLIAAVLAVWSVKAERDVVIAQGRTPMMVTRLFTGPDGKTHAETIEMKFTHRGRSAEMDLSDTVKVSVLQFQRTSPNFLNDFHPAPTRQFVVTLSGRAEVELEDGTKIPLTPGHILLAEDTTGKGHISRGLGSEDRLALAIQLADK